MIEAFFEDLGINHRMLKEVEMLTPDHSIFLNDLFTLQSVTLLLSVKQLRKRLACSTSLPWTRYSYSNHDNLVNLQGNNWFIYSSCSQVGEGLEIIQLLSYLMSSIDDICSYVNPQEVVAPKKLDSLLQSLSFL